MLLVVPGDAVHIANVSLRTHCAFTSAALTVRFRLLLVL